jgi:hypothetical protein
MFQVPGVAEFVFAIALLLIQNAGGIGEVDVWAGFRRRFVGKHGAENGVDHQFRMATWASNVQVVYILLGHGKYSTPFCRGLRSSDDGPAHGPEETLDNSAIFVDKSPFANNHFRPVSMRYFLSVHT